MSPTAFVALARVAVIGVRRVVVVQSVIISKGLMWGLIYRGDAC